MNECKILELHSLICFLYQLGVNPPADIASGRIAEVRSRSMSCNCMTRTSQQECRGILEKKRSRNTKAEIEELVSPANKCQ